MKPPTFKEERKLWKRGYGSVVGIDEVGRGPLAGPVVAAAFLVRPNFNMPRPLQKELRDSKKLSAKKRLKFYRFFQSHPDMEWGIGRVSEKVIDSINILQATKLAMKLALIQLEKKTGKADFLILDGNFTIDSKLPQKAVPKGDEKVFSCAAASIVAKVTRDRMMVTYHRKYPTYGFDRHKGYGTQFHRDMLKKYGLCKLHRKSFSPISQMSNL